MNLDLTYPPNLHRSQTPNGVSYSKKGDTTFLIYREAKHSDTQIADAINYLARTQKGSAFTIKNPREK